MSSVTDAAPSDDEEELPKRQPEDVPEVVRRSIEGKAARRRLGVGDHGSVVGVSRRRRPSGEARGGEDGADGTMASHCRHCGADLSDFCSDCHAKRISLDYEVDEGVVRAVDGEIRGYEAVQNRKNNYLYYFIRSYISEIERKYFCSR